MSLRPEVIFVKALLPQRSIIGVSKTQDGSAMTTSDSKSRLLRLAEWRENRLQERGPWPRRFVALGGAVILTAGTGVAFAAWTSSGAGTAGAKAGSISFAIDGTSSPNPTNTLHPGSTAGTATGDAKGGDLLVTVKNTSGFMLHVSKVQQNGPITVSGGGGGCTNDAGSVGTPTTPGSVTTAGTSGVSLPTWTAPDSTTTVAGDSTDHLVTIPNALTMATSSDTSCQGATFSIPVIVTLSS